MKDIVLGGFTLVYLKSGKGSTGKGCYRKRVLQEKGLQKGN